MMITMLMIMVITMMIDCSGQLQPGSLEVANVANVQLDLLDLVRAIE